MVDSHPERPPVVLNVEDDPDSRFALSHVLKTAGFEVWEAPSGGEALRLAARKPDLVVLDVHLPDQDGFAVCRRLKSDPATARTPVLMLSGEAVSSADRVHGLEGGADAYLTKPVEPGEVVAQARALVRVRQAEEAYRRMAAERNELLARLRLQIERMPIGCLVTGPDGRYTGWNPAAERIFGFTQQEALGRTPFELVVKPGTEELIRDTWRRLYAGDMSAHFTAECRAKDGRTVLCEWYNTPLRGPDGTVESILSMVLDVTERHRLEEQVRQAQKLEAIGQLAGGVAHDFNNLLTIINGYSDLVLESLRPDDPARGLLDEIKKAGERSASLTRQLLAFSRKQVLAPRVLDLNAVILDTEKMLQRVIGEDVRLTTDLHPRLGGVKADAGQLQQVLLNLAVNARDAMPRGGRLTIVTRAVTLDEGAAHARPGVRPGPYALLEVADTGCGMVPEVRAHIFEPFFTTKGPGKGTGLGLAVVHGIVQQAGGHIEVSSEPGAGTAVAIYLPLVGQPARSGKSFAGPPPAPRGSETVLLVEDDGAVRALARHVLLGAGYAVLEAGNGEEALRVGAEHRGAIHLLVTDVVMPDMGGRQLAERLLGLRPEMRVLYVSGYTDDAVVRHGVLEDEVHFLPKPFLPDALAHKVREVLDAPAGRR
jgi:PAS domain S-box-containing protein